jgi:hypothetical protein
VIIFLPVTEEQWSEALGSVHIQNEPELKHKGIKRLKTPRLRIACLTEGSVVKGEDSWAVSFHDR